MNNFSSHTISLAKAGLVSADSRAAQFCFLSAALVYAFQGVQVFSQLLLKFIWSDLGKALLGSSIFYPTLAMTVLFLVARVVPNRVVTACTGFCKRKALAAWEKVRHMLAKYDSLIAKLWAKRAQILTSVRVMVGAWEIFCL